MSIQHIGFAPGLMPIVLGAGFGGASVPPEMIRPSLCSISRDDDEEENGGGAEVVRDPQMVDFTLNTVRQMDKFLGNEWPGAGGVAEILDSAPVTPPTSLFTDQSEDSSVVLDGTFLMLESLSSVLSQSIELAGLVWTASAECRLKLLDASDEGRIAERLKMAGRSDDEARAIVKETIAEASAGLGPILPSLLQLEFRIAEHGGNRTLIIMLENPEIEKFYRRLAGLLLMDEGVEIEMPNPPTYVTLFTGPNGREVEIKNDEDLASRTRFLSESEAALIGPAVLTLPRDVVEAINIMNDFKISSEDREETFMEDLEVMDDFVEVLGMSVSVLRQFLQLGIVGGSVASFRRHAQLVKEVRKNARFQDYTVDWKMREVAGRLSQWPGDNFRGLERFFPIEASRGMEQGELLEILGREELTETIREIADRIFGAGPSGNPDGE